MSPFRCWEPCFHAASDKPQMNLPMASCGTRVPSLERFCFPHHTMVPFFLCKKKKNQTNKTPNQQKTPNKKTQTTTTTNKPLTNQNKPMCLLLPGQNVISVIMPTSGTTQASTGVPALFLAAATQANVGFLRLKYKA